VALGKREGIRIQVQKNRVSDRQSESSAKWVTERVAHDGGRLCKEEARTMPRIFPERENVLFLNQRVVD
jgi:hypothetical protein